MNLTVGWCLKRYEKKMLSCPSSRRRLSGKSKKLIDMYTSRRTESERSGLVGPRGVGKVKWKCFKNEVGRAQTKVLEKKWK